MAASYEIFPKQYLIISSFSGLLTEEDIISLRLQVNEDPRFQPDFNVIDNVTGVTRIKIDTNRLFALSQKTLVVPGVRRALVAETDLQFGMSRMYQVFSEEAGQQFRVCRTLDEALAWINQQN